MDLAESRAVFATTHWSVVLAAGGAQDAHSRAALGTLCQAYWPPLYAFARRSGIPPEDARDLTQGFFARMIEKDWVAAADAGRGRFRALLLTMFRRFMADERDKATAAKRGGMQELLSLDAETEEGRLALDPPDLRTPQRAYEHRWAEGLLQRVFVRLREEFTLQGRQELFDPLKVYLSGDSSRGGYAELAATLGMTEGAAKMSVSRMRQRYRQLLRAEIAQTVSHAGEIDEELRYLATVLNSHGASQGD